VNQSPNVCVKPGFTNKTLSFCAYDCGTMTNAVELTQVTKRFGEHSAVSELDLAVPTGSIYGFVGPNGSGKTTTIRMILRIFQPDEGTVRVLGQDTGAAADDRLGYLPEERGLYKRMKVGDLLTYYARLKGFRDCHAGIDEWLNRLGAGDWRNKKIDSLSKGMAQKVQFISAVVARPQLLILDEPFSGLDPVNMEVLRDAVLSLRERGTTIIFSTHDMDVAEKLCDTVFMIFQGRKVLDGSVESIQRDYAADTLKIRLASGEQLPATLPGIESQREEGLYHYLKLAHADESQIVLRQLMDSVRVEHFELVRPSLHDIFVGIARPQMIAAEPVAQGT